MHNAGYRALGLDWHYVPFEVTHIGKAVEAMRTLGLRGAGISYPFKESVMPLLDRVDDDAAKMGAVNTVVNTGGHLVGYNTDWVGGARALQEVTSLRAKRVLVLGAGGAARAVATGLSREGAALTIVNRTYEKAQALASALHARAARPGETDLSLLDIVVNATSVGMSGVSDALPLDPAGLSAHHVVMDIVYKPLRTPWLLAAADRGATVIGGERMLLHQAAAQFAHYTQREAPLAAMAAALTSLE
jgi:shikimate dehydrogenase